MTTSSRIARLHAHCKAACACSRFTELNTLYDPHVHVALPSYQATWPAALCVVYSRAPRRGRARAGAGLPTAALARRRSGNRCEVCAHVGKGTKPTELWTLSAATGPGLTTNDQVVRHSGILGSVDYVGFEV